MAKKETKLDEIYGLLDYSQKTGIALNDEQLKQIAEKEEDLIKKEILPVLRDSIDPVMRRIRTDLTLVVGYHPNAPITLRISRQSDLGDLGNAAVLTPDDIPGMKRRNGQRRGTQRNPIKALRVRMSDGKIIKDKNATETFCDVIERIGLMKVRALDIKLSGLNLVSTTKDPNRQQRKVDSLYIFTNISTATKKKILDRISKTLKLRMTVEVIDK